MGMFRLMGLFAIIPATVLLAISFFVLLSLRKVEIQWLKAFGYVVAALLWISALMVFSLGIYKISTGSHLFFCPMQQMMKGHVQGMMIESPR